MSKRFRAARSALPSRSGCSTVAVRWAGRCYATLMFYLQISTFWRADERTRTAFCSLRVIGQGLQGLLGVANPPYLKGFSFSTLLSVAPYSVPGGIRLVSTEHSSFTIVLTRARFRSTPSTWPTHQHKAHSRALIPLDALDEPEHCRGDGRSVGERSLAGPVVTATGTYQAASPQRGSASPRRCSLGVSFPVRDHIRSVSFGLFVTPHGLRLLTLFLHRWNAARTSVAKSSSSSHATKCPPLSTSFLTRRA